MEYVGKIMLDLIGRIYIAKQGLRLQVSGGSRIFLKGEGGGHKIMDACGHG